MSVLTSTKCPNCDAIGLTEKDHDTGERSPNQWLCDTYEIVHAQPNFELTYVAAKKVQEGLRTSPDPDLRKLAELFDFQFDYR